MLDLETLKETPEWEAAKVYYWDILYKLIGHFKALNW